MDNHLSTLAGFVIAAPSSGMGKTLISLGLMRALKARGLKVGAAKSGPDYIDPQFHKAALIDHSELQPSSFNLDAWAMSKAQLRYYFNHIGKSMDFVVVEGAMGLFDGPFLAKADDSMPGSTGDLASCLGLPVILVMDVARQAQTAAVIALGLANHREDVRVKGVILNKVGSARHEKMLRNSFESHGIKVLGALPHQDHLQLPSRHLGLVEPDDLDNIERFINDAAQIMDRHIDLDALISIARDKNDLHKAHDLSASSYQPLPPLGQRIAIARDRAFSFIYPHLLADWRDQGAELMFFSPLDDESAPDDCDAIYLPGGYPELHAGQLSGAAHFKASMHHHAKRGTLIYGECGGYMVLGDILEDAKGDHHPMLELLPLQTSFKNPQLHLGYRRLKSMQDMGFSGDQNGSDMTLMAHEFHYARILKEGDAERLFQSEDAARQELIPMGLRLDNVMGSFAHLICLSQD